MNTIFKKSFKDTYFALFLIALSAITIFVDHKYNQLHNVRALVNDIIIYPINYITTIPRQIIEITLEDSLVKSEMEKKISDLESENRKLKVQLQEYQSLKDENKRLRKISKESLKMSDNQTLAKVINNNAHPNKKVVLIDKGEKDGVFNGQNVLGLKGLIGQVIDTSFLSAKVLLISDVNHNIPSQITRTGEKIIVKGKNENDELDILFAPINLDIKVGDNITTSGMADRFKPNIPIGKVKFIDNSEEKKFSIIHIEPFENIGNSAELILIWDYKPKIKRNGEGKKENE